MNPTMIYSPMEQFAITPLIPIEIGQFDISFTNSSLSIVIAISTFLFFFVMTQVAGFTIIPSRWQAFIETLYQFVMTLVNDNLGEHGKKYFPFIFTLFIFILFCNVLGVIPYSFTATSHIIVTFTLALSIWIGVVIIGIMNHGVKFSAFLLPAGVPLVMAPLIVPIELLSYMARPFSLSIRLFANMMSGHMLFKIMAGFSWTMLAMSGAIFFIGFVPILFLVVLTGLEIAICCIQAYVFAILTILYINDSIHLH